MLPLLLLSNCRLVIYLFGALVFGAMSWLYFDALFVRANKTMLGRAIGASLIAISYLIGAVLVEGLQIEQLAWLADSMWWLRLGGYLILAIGVWSEPLSKRPTRIEDSTKHSRLAFAAGIKTWMLPIFPAIVGLGYWRRASVGLERHLSRTAYGMYILSIAEIIDLRRLFVNSHDIRMYELVGEFGSLWIVQLVILTLGLILVSIWVFSYLLRRFETQITLFMGMLVMGVFAIATLSLTYVMADRLEIGAVNELQAAVRMINNNWERKGDALLARAKELSTVSIDDKEALTTELAEGEYVTDTDSRNVITREKIDELHEGIGYYLEGIGSGRVLIMRAVAKHKDGGLVVVQKEMDGKVMSESAEETEFAIRIYEDKKVVESSLVPGYPKIITPKGISEGQGGDVGGVKYLSARIPLKTSEGAHSGELVVAQPIMEIWKSIAEALRITYLVGVITLLLMEIPAILIGKYLTKQL